MELHTAPAVLPPAFHKKYQYVFSLLALEVDAKSIERLGLGKTCQKSWERRKHQYSHLNEGGGEEGGGDRPDQQVQGHRDSIEEQEIESGHILSQTRSPTSPAPPRSTEPATPRCKQPAGV